MPDINPLILEKLKEYPSEVSDIAQEAVRLAERLPLQAVEEDLQARIRQAVRKRKSKG